MNSSVRVLNWLYPADYATCYADTVTTSWKSRNGISSDKVRWQTRWHLCVLEARVELPIPNLPLQSLQGCCHPKRLYLRLPREQDQLRGWFEKPSLCNSQTKGLSLPKPWTMRKWDSSTYVSGVSNHMSIGHQPPSFLCLQHKPTSCSFSGSFLLPLRKVRKSLNQYVQVRNSSQRLSQHALL